MKSKVTIEISLPAGASTVNFPEPCTYCGQHVTNTSKSWEHDIVRGSSGTFKLRAPYCSEHENKPKSFTMVTIIVWLIMAIAATSLLLFIGDEIISMAFPMNVLMLSALFFPFAIGHWIFAPFIKRLITWIKPELLECSVSDGHWGLELGRSRDEFDEKARRLVTILPVNFVSVESAQRFSAAYPDARVVKGMELLEQVPIETH